MHISKLFEGKSRLEVLAHLAAVGSFVLATAQVLAYALFP